MIELIGDPRKTQFVRLLQRVAALVEGPTVFFLTTTHWQQLAAELDAQYRKPEDVSRDPLTPANFKEVKWGNLTVRNAGTEDQGVVNYMNRDDVQRSFFVEKRAALAQGERKDAA